MVKIYHKTVKDEAPKVIDDFKVGSWIFVEEPTEAEIKHLSEKFALEEGLLRDATDPHEVPRIEREGEVIYIFTRVPHQDGQRVMTLPLLIGIGKEFVITVSHVNLPLFDKFLEGKIDFSTTQKTKFFILLFSEINATYNSFLTTISRRVRSLGAQLENITNRQIMQFVSFESIVNDFLAALVPTSAILNNVLVGKHIELYDEDRDLVEDLLLSNGQLIESAKSNLKNIVNVREANSTIMTNNLNRVIKLLTSLTIITTVPMIISSFYGMNVILPFAESPLAFVGILAISFLLILILLIIFIKNEWL